MLLIAMAGSGLSGDSSVHPWHGREFLLIRGGTGRRTRAFFLDDQGVQHSLPVGWTDAVAVDAFVVAAAGRCPFRVADLTALAGLIDGLRAGPGSGGIRR